MEVFKYKNKIDVNILQMVGRRINGVTYFYVQYLNGEKRRYAIFNEKDAA